ncbi:MULTISPECIES: VPA1262 family protein [unclassified Pseudomonas]|uniref:VPA1262 family protein n=1 Tax=unclassified Pseudomonas TaxID=196821 RepID=UPI00211740B3|nr:MULTISPECIES: VPA1262 family protein [unclassified Pseudomonas]
MTDIQSIINDTNLQRLFDDTAGDNCAIQIWLLQTIQDESKITNLLYARFLPSSYQGNEWHAPKEDHFKIVSNTKSQILPLNLYCAPSKASNTLENLLLGKTIEQISRELDITISSDLAERIKDFTIQTDVIYKPTTLITMRNGPRSGTIRSPHGTASAFSASIILPNRSTTFNIENTYNTKLVEFAISQLNKDTGMQFHNEDSPRLGSVELLVFPTLNEKEKDNLHASWDRHNNIFTVELDLTTEEEIQKITSASLVIHFINDNQKIHSLVLTQQPVEGTVIFLVEAQAEYINIIDSVKFEIFTSTSNSSVGKLHCSYDVSYMRANAISTRIGTISGKSINFDWLTNVINSSPKTDRIKALQTINHGSKATTSKFKNEIDDPWVRSNHQMKSLIKEAFPEVSEGGFFQRFRDSGGLGRVEFVEWIHRVIGSYQEHQLVIFDPYFEDVGISLLLPKASTGSEYIVITTYESGQPNPRIANCTQAYQQVSTITDNINFKLYGIPKDFLHDRYIIVSDHTGKPIKGFHLSNSLQSATDNYPLLITIIPGDILPKVAEYTHNLLTKSTLPINTLELLIDSTTFIKQRLVTATYEPLSFLDAPLAAKAIAAWTNNAELANLSAQNLKTKLEQDGYTKDNILNSKKLGSPENFLISLHKVTEQELSDYWEIGANILAHSPTRTLKTFIITESIANKLSLLLIKKSKSKPPEELEPAQEVYIASSLRSSIEELLLHARGSDFVHPTKFKSLSWGDFYAIKFLWIKQPSVLFHTLSSIDKEINLKNANQTIACAVAAQIICEISMSAIIGLTPEYSKLLMSQKKPLLRWLGYSGLETLINKNPRNFNLIKSITNTEQKLVTGWIVNNSYRRDSDNTIYKKSIKHYLTLFQFPTSKENTKELFKNLRNHMNELSYCYPWLITEIVNPLLEKEIINISFLAEVWLDEILFLIEKLTKNGTSIFQTDHQAKTTDVGAFLLANSNTTFQKEVFAMLTTKLGTLKRKIQKPLASTTNWTEWDNHLKASFWIYGYLKWVRHHLPVVSEIHQDLDHITQFAYEISSGRSLNDWRRLNYSGGQYSVFLEERPS